MRSRSHRLPTAEPRHDDWVDGSWTVDCVCGVTFDDGEEMVNCDECGVWVHTRCSRYVKSEKSFACDKCKSKSKSGGGIIGNESEETEVAEFLVELPNKAMGTDNPNPATVASRRPFRLWAETPMEERVHVQGIPGGEPSLFSGINMSSIFGSQLWKSTGYVPKKFSLRYSEFPFSGQGKEEEEDMDKTNGEKSSARADNGARVLVSLLNKSESSLPTPVVDSAAVKGLVEGRVCGEIAAPRQKKLDSEKSHSVPEDSMKKKRNSVTVVLNPGKRKKEEHRALKDQNVKKKVRVVEKEGDVRKRATHEPKASASTFSRDAKLLESSQDRGCKGVNSDLQCGKNPSDHLPDRLGECATNLASNEHGIESTPKNDISNGEALRVETKGAHVPVECENLSNTCNGMESLAEVNCLQSLPVKEEVTGDTLQRCVAGTGSLGIGSCEKEPAAAGVKLAAGDAKESGHGQESDLDEANSRPVKKLRTDLDADDNKDHVVESVHLNEVKLDGPKASIQPILSVKVVSGEGEVVGTSNMKAEASEAKLLDANRSLVVCRPRTDKPDESNANAHLSKREHSASEGSLGAKKRSSGLKPSSEAADELLKSNGTARSHSSASYQRKAGVTVLRSNSTSGIMSKSSENCTGAAAQNSSIHVRQELSDSSQGTMKDNASADKVDRVEKSGRTKKLVKESLRSGALSKVSETNKLTNTTDSKKIPSDSKDPSVHSSSKVPLGSKVASTNVSGESASPPPTEGGSSMQSKGAASAIPGKGEKPHQSGCNPSSRGHVAAMTSPASSNVPATLSDEELALLLHQELNSSPRVPRVPRMRHAGSLPQLTGPSATSVLMKRTSNGVKDHGMVSRRRTKDSSGEGLHAYPKNDSEAKKMERKPNSPDNRRQDSSYSIDQQSRKEADGGMVKSSQSMKKTNTNSSLSSSTVANGHHMSSSHLSSRNASNDDTRIAGRQTNRTLPGLIAEIMSEGKRMTYEELCNAVLPHWPHLRKHNGERYAYSSHSQAVLDCLRNRSEWARLVDRGPKTNASRKRHKHDADSMSVESEDNEDHTIKNSKEDGSKSFDSHQEEFPKGKRKARKRRRLALQGRGIVRRRRRADVVSDDESESFSYSSEESASSEEEIQGAGTSAVGSEVSGSSDEAE